MVTWPEGQIKQKNPHISMFKRHQAVFAAVQHIAATVKPAMILNDSSRGRHAVRPP
jgi:hypothetical protein